MLLDAALEISSIVSNDELIVVDNGSGDNSVSVLKNLTGDDQILGQKIHSADVSLSVHLDRTRCL